ncbi:hypothetical protein ACOSP7_003416 [Xanthoceras sorbifolium]
MNSVIATASEFIFKCFASEFIFKCFALSNSDEVLPEERDIQLPSHYTMKIEPYSPLSKAQDKICVSDESNSFPNDNWTVCVNFKLFVLNQKTMQYLTIQDTKRTVRKLGLWPKGYMPSNGELSFFLYPTNWEPKRKLYAKYKLRVLNRFHDKTIEKSVSHWFDSKEGWGYKNLKPLKDINELFNGYLKDDTLIVEVEFDIISSTKVRL